MKFSVLMSIYKKEEPSYFKRAMLSIWDEQIVKPDEIVLVQDGPLTDELYEVVNEWKVKIGESFKTIPLEKNVGLGDALNEGIKHCGFELIARMDTDDIALPERFEKQLEIFKSKSIDICSSWVSEFDDNEEMIVSYRKIPESHKEIYNYAFLRNPVNHPAVMYKKSSVLSVNSYKKMMWFEDYYLWIRMLLNGSEFYNIQTPLVKMRAGYGQLERRGGFKYAIAEYNFLLAIKKLGFLNLFQFLKKYYNKVFY
jgi:glycosyltransferase involved in cell wall biosynthesis